MNIVILGAQGSGKGTQAKLIAEKFRWPHISTGDIFRENIRKQTVLGELAKKYIDKGKLVPDKVTIAIINDRLKKKDCAKGFVLDGFPRNISQAKALSKIARIDLAIEIAISDKEAMKRISGRRTCESCGAITSVFSKDAKKCTCGGKLIVRDDDKPAAVKKRLDIYHSMTEPLIKFYQKQGIMVRINGEQPIPNVWKDILKQLKR